MMELLWEECKMKDSLEQCSIFLRQDPHIERIYLSFIRSEDLYVHVLSSTIYRKVNTKDNKTLEKAIKSAQILDEIIKKVSRMAVEMSFNAQANKQDKFIQRNEKVLGDII